MGTVNTRVLAQFLALAVAWGASFLFIKDRPEGPVAQRLHRHLPDALVGVALGVLVLDEHVSWNQPAGALVVVSIAISQDRLTVVFRSLRTLTEASR